MNIVKYYHPEIVRANDKDKDIRDNGRKELDIMRAINYKLGGLMIPPNTT